MLRSAPPREQAGLKASSSGGVGIFRFQDNLWRPNLLIGPGGFFPIPGISYCGADATRGWVDRNACARPPNPAPCGYIGCGTSLAFHGYELIPCIDADVCEGPHREGLQGSESQRFLHHEPPWGASPFAGEWNQ